MTDLDKLKGLLSEFGVGYSSIQEGNVDSIVCTAGAKRVDGHIDFYAEYEFTSEGAFINMGVWE